MILKLEDQVNTIQQGKRLQELGVKAESVFVWDGNGNLYFIDANGDYVRCIDFKTLAGFMMPNGIFPAYTVAEGLAMLPDYYIIEKEGGDYYCYKYKHGGTFKGETAAQAVWNCIIHLLETGRITAAEINRKFITN